MILVNNGTNPLAHGNYKLAKGEKADIPDNIAKNWLKISGIERYIAPAELEKAAAQTQAKADEAKKALEAENQKLKAELEELKKAQAKADEAKKADKK